MLKYSFKLVTSPELQPIDYSELYVAKDLSYISGVTDYHEGMRNGEEVSISSPFLNYNVRRPIILKLVRRQGYVLVKERYQIHSLKNIGPKNEEVFYIEYKGVYYYMFDNFSIKGFMIDGNFIQTNSDNTVTIPTKYWIENGKVEIKGEWYYVDTNLIPNQNFLNGYEEPTIKKYGDNSILEKIDGQNVKIIDYEYSKWHNIYKFTIQTNGRDEFLIKGATTGDYFPFVKYNDEIYTIKTYDDGYGTFIEGKFYPMSDVSSFEEFTSLDNPLIKIEDKTLSVNTTFMANGNGSNLVLFTEDENKAFNPYDVIIAESDDLEFVKKVCKSDSGIFYVEYDGIKYNVESNVCDTIKINEVDYEITYTNRKKTLGFITIEDKKIELSFYQENGIKKSSIKNQIYYLNDKGIVEFGSQKKSSTEPFFEVTETSGITLDNGVKCPVFAENRFITKNENGIENDLKCFIKGHKKYELQIAGLEGAQMLICSSISSEDDIFEQKRINSEICDNVEHFHFYFKNTLFGDRKITPMIGAESSLLADHPISSKTITNFDNGLIINQIHNYITLPIGLGEKVDPSINKDDITQNEFVNDRIVENINNTVDMEKDVYYPAFKKEGKFAQIEELVFNLHFRTRDLDSWKVIQDNSIEIATVNGHSLVYSPNNNECNWFVTDYYDYQESNQQDDLQNSSDLIGFLGFDDNDISYRKNKISKSFLRLSFYSTTNPQTQVLLSTSTIFMDENRLFKKMLNGKMVSGDTFKEVQFKEDLENMSFYKSPNVISELYDNSNKQIKIDKNKRLDSSFIVKDKYNTDTSSEGFYLYLFREYSSKLREGTIYMKVDFCHAGNGLVIPFIIPKSIETGSILYLNNYNDINEMKEGIPLNKVYDNLYIPIKVIYSESDNKYWYYLPSEYIENSTLGFGEENDNKMIFNLFELKIRNQSYETTF